MGAPGSRAGKRPRAAGRSPVTQSAGGRRSRALSGGVLSWLGCDLPWLGCEDAHRAALPPCLPLLSLPVCPRWKCGFLVSECLTWRLDGATQVEALEVKRSLKSMAQNDSARGDSLP